MIQIAQLLLLEERAQQCMRKGCLRCVAFGSGDSCNNSGALPGASLDSVAAAAAAVAGSRERPAATELLAEALAESAAAAAE